LNLCLICHAFGGRADGDAITKNGSSLFSVEQLGSLRA